MKGGVYTTLQPHKACLINLYNAALKSPSLLIKNEATAGPSKEQPKRVALNLNLLRKERGKEINSNCGTEILWHSDHPSVVFVSFFLSFSLHTRKVIRHDVHSSANSHMELVSSGPLQKASRPIGFPLTHVAMFSSISVHLRSTWQKKGASDWNPVCRLPPTRRLRV